MHLHAPSGQAPELIEIAKAIEKRRCPGISAASGVGRFGEPERFARLEFVAEPAVKSLDCICAGKKILRKSRVGSSLRCGSHRGTPFRRRSVRMIREAIEAGSGGLKNVFSLHNTPRESDGSEGNSFPNAAGTKDEHVGRGFLDEGKENGKI